MERMITLSSMVVADGQLISRQIGQQVAILVPTSGECFCLNEVGTQIWVLIQQPRNVSEIRDTILNKYEVETPECEQDLISLLQKLLEKGIIGIRNEATI